MLRIERHFSGFNVFKNDCILNFLKSKEFVFAAPHIMSRDLEERCENPFLIVCCDGVWDVIRQVVVVGVGSVTTIISWTMF